MSEEGTIKKVNQNLHTCFQTMDQNRWIKSYDVIEAPTQMVTAVRQFDINNRTFPFHFFLQRGPIHSFSSSTFNRTGIVVASNEYCSSKAGLLKVILNMGGPRLCDDIESLPIDSRSRRCLPGNAVQVRNGPYGELQVSCIIFAVGPWQSSQNNSLDTMETLKSAYRQALRRAKESKLESVAFSCIGASRAGGGIHRMQALQSGLNEIVSFEGYPELKEIHLYAYSSEEEQDLLQASEKACREFLFMTPWTPMSDIFNSENPYNRKKKLTKNVFSVSSYESGNYIYYI
jgi:O-acetyl-ADP-ribose deacetylase (regulator of RNase III)